MSTPKRPTTGALQVVLADANVLYSRSLRDYLLYATEHELVNITWSQSILDETVNHMVANLPGFTIVSARRLIKAMTTTFPYATVEPTDTDFARLSGVTLLDENDRHVIAAALAADAEIICTSNTKHFPAAIMSRFGLQVV